MAENAKDVIAAWLEQMFSEAFDHKRTTCKPEELLSSLSAAGLAVVPVEHLGAKLQDRLDWLESNGPSFDNWGADLATMIAAAPKP